MSRIAVALLLGAVLLSPAATPDLMVVTLAVLALGAALARSIATPLDLRVVLPPAVRAAVPTPRGRVTDRSHHPIAPRAPGPA